MNEQGEWGERGGGREKEGKLRLLSEVGDIILFMYLQACCPNSAAKGLFCNCC